LLSVVCCPAAATPVATIREGNSQCGESRKNRRTPDHPLAICFITARWYFPTLEAGAGAKRVRLRAGESVRVGRRCVARVCPKGVERRGNGRSLKRHLGLHDDVAVVGLVEGCVDGLRAGERKERKERDEARHDVPRGKLYSYSLKIRFKNLLADARAG